MNLNNRYLRNLALFLSLCTICNQALAGTSSDLQNSTRTLGAIVDSIKKARDYRAYEGSSRKVEQFFHYLNGVDIENRNTSKSLLCNTLKNTSHEDLALISTEVESPSHQSLLTGCREQILSKIDQYYSTQKIRLARQYGNGVSPTIKPFKVKIVEIDNSQAKQYQTADLNPGEIALTFDDGPHPRNTGEVLSTLEKFGAKATFFTQGVAAQSFPQNLKEIAEKGHSIGSHSFSHPKFATEIRKGNMSFDQAVDDIMRGHETIYAILGWIDPFFRFPHADTNQDLKNFIRDERLASFFWNMDSLDWQRTDPKQLVDATLDVISKNNYRGILLFHDTKRQTAMALPIILDYLRQKDVTLVLFVPKESTVRTFNVPLVKSSQRFDLIEFAAKKARDKREQNERQGLKN